MVLTVYLYFNLFKCLFIYLLCLHLVDILRYVVVVVYMSKPNFGSPSKTNSLSLFPQFSLLFFIKKSSLHWRCN